VLVLVDPRQLAPGKVGELPLLRTQAEAADVLVATHTDVCSPDDLERFEAWGSELWPPPVAVHRAAHGRPAHEHHDHGRSSLAGFAARSWRWAPEAVFSRERLLDALARLAGGAAGAPLARLKGIFRTQEGVFRIEIAAGDLIDRPSAYRRDSRVDVIVQGEHPAPLEQAGAWLESALLRDDELRLDLERIELVLPEGRVHLLDRARLDALPDPVPDIGALFAKRSGRAARIARLWQSLGLEPRGRAVVVAGDGFASEPVDVAVLCQGFLLHSLGDGPLPPEQGGPFRLLIPEQAGAPLGACANVKGVAKLVVRND
jgi:hypothetical protein